MLKISCEIEELPETPLSYRLGSAFANDVWLLTTDIHAVLLKIPHHQSRSFPTLPHTPHSGQLTFANWVHAKITNRMSESANDFLLAWPTTSSETNHFDGSIRTHQIHALLETGTRDTCLPSSTAPFLVPPASGWTLPQAALQSQASLNSESPVNS